MAYAMRLILSVLISLLIKSAAVKPELIGTPPPLPVLADIFSKLGFQELASATAAANLSAAAITVFAPTDSALLTCPSCSVPLLLQEHSVPGLYPLHYLRNFAFGTKITSLAPNRCLAVTSSTDASAAFPAKKVFVNGAEITKPDVFNNGRVIIHGIQGFVSHLSPISCRIERQVTLNFLSHAPPAAATFATRLMLKEAMMRLRGSGHSILALAMRVRYPELIDLNNFTVFAIDDESIFAGGGRQSYVANLGFHILPNRLLMGSELITLPPGTVLTTMEKGRNLVVTTAGGGGQFTPLRINFVKIKGLDLMYNSRIAVHGLSVPFPRIGQDQTAEKNSNLIDGQDDADV